MKTCNISILFSYAALIYLFASIIYMIITRNYGTPFKTAVKQYPELQNIKQKSVDKRKKAFYTGILIACVILLCWRPFKLCWK